MTAVLIAKSEVVRKLLYKPLAIILVSLVVFVFFVGVVVSLAIWSFLGKQEAFWYGATINPIYLGVLLSDYTIITISISICMTLVTAVLTRSKKKSALVLCVILGGYWLFLVLFANSRAFLD